MFLVFRKSLNTHWVRERDEGFRRRSWRAGRAVDVERMYLDAEMSGRYSEGAWSAECEALEVTVTRRLFRQLFTSVLYLQLVSSSSSLLSSMGCKGRVASLCRELGCFDVLFWFSSIRLWLQLVFLPTFRHT